MSGSDCVCVCVAFASLVVVVVRSFDGDMLSEVFGFGFDFVHSAEGGGWRMRVVWNGGRCEVLRRLRER